MFSKILIANRGEIAVRITRTCREMGIHVTTVYSDADARARHVTAADEAVHLPGVAPADTYLNIDAIVDAARRAGAEAVHPGYGFLSERAEAAGAVVAAGMAWVGPPAEALRLTGDKVRARRLAEGAGVSPVPGTLEPVRDSAGVIEFADRHGYPVAIKAAGGGGGRGLKVAGNQGEVAAALESAIREAEAYFGYGDVYLERYLPAPKHIEVQVLSEGPGRSIWLGARDCSLQRRHQKLVEETPPLRLAELVPRIGEAAVAVADACGYVNAGTVEFLVDPQDREFFFLEVNARLQVEHTITEEVLGIDLVAAQLRIASGEPLGFGQPDVLPGGLLRPRGHSIECRINAEDPGRGFLPTPGLITRYQEPGGPGIRVDSGFGEGDEIPPAYDSLIAKLVAWAPTRENARRRMLRALEEFVVEGVSTTIPAHRVLLEADDFVYGTYTTRTIEGGALKALIADTAPPPPDVSEGARDSGVLWIEGTPARLWHPAMARSAPGAGVAGTGSGQGAVVAPMHGTILKVLMQQGDVVEAGHTVAILEAMKMETQLIAPVGGTVKTIDVETGDIVESGRVIATIE